jgi:hypothetical protein
MSQSGEMPDIEATHASIRPKPQKRSKRLC